MTFSCISLDILVHFCFMTHTNKNGSKLSLDYLNYAFQLKLCHLMALVCIVGYLKQITSYTIQSRIRGLLDK